MTGIINKVTGFNTTVEMSEITRYMGMGGVSADGALLSLIDKCREDFMPAISAKACYLECEVRLNGDDGLHNISIGDLCISSKDLCRVMKDCDRAVIIAATIGHKADLLVKNAMVTSESRALVYNSLGTCAIEAYMGQLTRMLASEYRGYALRPRFSPGYGDLPLLVQKDLMRILDCNRKIGVSLSKSLLMSPSKSVTAFIGISDEGCTVPDKDCDICPNTDCGFRLA